jgi:CheY-like chemotaxis protein
MGDSSEVQRDHIDRNQNGRAWRVLVVDDKADTANMIAAALAATGFATWVAHDGPGAIDLAARLELDVMLVDLAMPGMNGWEVARRCRKLELAKPLRLVAMSGLDQDVHRKQSRLAGFDAHLVKPFALHVLIDVLVPANCTR